MKKGSALTVSFSVLEPNTYLVVSADESLLIDYCAQMNERNHIPGLLALQRQSINGEMKLYYDITGKKKLTSFAAGSKLSKPQGEHIFRSLLGCFHQLPEYFLRPGMCLLDLDFLFVDDHLNTYLPLLPLSSAPAQSSGELREFFLAMLGECFVGDHPEPYFDRILKYLIRPDFSLEALEELALPQAPQPQFTPVKPAQAAPPQTAQPVGPSAPPVAQTPPKAPPAAPVPGMNFAIPGGGPAPVSAPPKKKKEKAPAEKSQHKLFGGFGKKSAPTPPKLNMTAESHLLSGSAPSGGALDAPYAPPLVPPQPPVVSSLEQDDWQGTVSLESADERTVFLSTPATFGPVLIHQSRRIGLPAAPFSIGKTNCSLNIANPKVSRTHATIYPEGGAWYIRDEGSTNHTYVDGSILPPYTPFQLKDKATILLANEEFHFEAGGPV